MAVLRVSLYVAEGPRTRKQGREGRVFMRFFFSFPLLGPNIKERKRLTDRQERAKAERERDRGVAAAADRHWPAVRGRANRDARDSRAPTRVRAPRGGQGGSRAAPANPASPLTPRFPVARAFGSSARAASSAKQGTDSAGEPSCRSLQEYKTSFFQGKCSPTLRGRLAVHLQLWPVFLIPLQ